METIAPSNDASMTARSASYTGTAGTTSAWPPGVQAVLVWTTTDAHVKVGASATATTADTPVPAYTPMVFKVKPESTEWRVSAIQMSAAGTVWAKPVAGR